MGSDRILLDALRTLIPFKSFSSEDLALLGEFCAFRKVRAGETLFCQGEPSPYCYGILSGEVTLHKVVPGSCTPMELLAVYKSGQLVGEFSLLAETPRAGMGSVTQDGELLSIWSSRFRDWVEKHRSISGDPPILAALRIILSSNPHFSSQ